jgi:hypothetical protein
MNVHILFNDEELCSSEPIEMWDLYENETPFYEVMMRRWCRSSRGLLFSEVNGSVWPHRQIL